MPEKKNTEAEHEEFTAHARAAGRAFVRQWKSLLPDEFWTYGAEAGRETLLAMRAAVDTCIARLEGVKEEVEQSPKRRTTRKAKVEVE